MNATLTAARWYAQNWRWQLFVLSASKLPLRLCDNCPPHGPEHDGEACECLTCHGFYAATSDPNRLAEMTGRHPTGGSLCAPARPPESQWWTSTLALAVKTHSPLWRRARAGCRTPEPRSPRRCAAVLRAPGAQGTSRAGTFADDLPGIDSKADDAYVVVPPSVRDDGEPYIWSRPGGMLTPLADYPALLLRLLDYTPPRQLGPHAGQVRSTGYESGRAVR